MYDFDLNWEAINLDGPHDMQDITIRLKSRSHVIKKSQVYTTGQSASRKNVHFIIFRGQVTPVNLHGCQCSRVG